METTFVCVRGNGFWIQDSLLALWLRFLALHAEDQQDPLCAASIMRSEWLVGSRGYFPGCLPFELQANVATDEGKLIFLQAVDALLVALRANPGYLDHRTLQVMGMEPCFPCDVETSLLVEVSLAFQDIVLGQPAAQAPSTFCLSMCEVAVSA